MRKLLLTLLLCMVAPNVVAQISVDNPQQNWFNGYVDNDYGYTINNQAPNGHCLVGNGLYYVDSSNCGLQSGFSAITSGQPLYAPNAVQINAGVDGSPTTPTQWDSTPTAIGVFAAGVIPASALAGPPITQFDAFDGVARADCAGCYAVGSASLGEANATPGSGFGGYAWGTNPQVQARPGSNLSVLHGNETDCENWGTNTYIDGCLQVNFYPETGGTLSPNSVGLDLTISPLPTAQTTNNQFSVGISLEPGFSAVGIVLNPVANSASQVSQPIQLISSNASNTRLISEIGADIAGDLTLSPSNSANVRINTQGASIQMMNSAGTAFNQLSTSNTAFRAQTLPDMSGTVALTLSGTTGNIGGSALALNACTSGTLSLTGATTSMVAMTNPSIDPNSGTTQSYDWYARVTSVGTVTVYECAIVAGTPTATTFNVRVIQ